MAHLTYSSYEGFGDRAKKDMWYSQAVRVGEIIICSGQGGWDRKTDAIPTDVTAQIEQAFENVQHTLENAGSKGWEEVFSVRCYTLSLDAETMGNFVNHLKKWCPNHQPVLTGVAVKELAFGMAVEIEVQAHVPKGKE